MVLILDLNMVKIRKYYYIYRSIKEMFQQRTSLNSQSKRYVKLQSEHKYVLLIRYHKPDVTFYTYTQYLLAPAWLHHCIYVNETQTFSKSIKYKEQMSLLRSDTMCDHRQTPMLRRNAMRNLPVQNCHNEDWGSTFLWNITVYLQSHTVSKPRRLPCDQHQPQKLYKTYKFLYNVEQIYLQKLVILQSHPQTQTDSSDGDPLSCFLDAAHFNTNQGKIHSDYHQLLTNYTSTQESINGVYNSRLFFFCSLFHNAVINSIYTALNDHSILKNELKKIWKEAAVA